MRYRGAAVIIALGALASACSALVDFKYLSGTDTDAGTGVGPDASSALDGASSGDGGNPGLEDSSTPTMNTTDGAPDQTVPYCQSLQGTPGLVFCADFDESTDPKAGWSGSDVPGSSSCTLLLTTMMPVSAPHALGAVTSSASDCSLFYHHAAVAGTVRVEADVHLASFPTKLSQVFPLALYQTPSYRAAVLGASATGWTAIDVPGASGMSTALNASPAGSSSANSWHHITVIITFTTALTSMTATVDNVTVVKEVALTSGFSAGDDWEIYVGLPMNNLAAQDAIDNVAIYMK